MQCQSEHSRESFSQSGEERAAAAASGLGKGAEARKLEIEAGNGKPKQSVIIIICIDHHHLQELQQTVGELTMDKATATRKFEEPPDDIHDTDATFHVNKSHIDPQDELAHVRNEFLERIEQAKAESDEDRGGDG